MIGFRVEEAVWSAAVSEGLPCSDIKCCHACCSRMRALFKLCPVVCLHIYIYMYIDIDID